MRSGRSALALASVVASLLLAAACQASPGEVALVSGPNAPTLDGFPAESQIPAISGSGRYVAFIADYTDTGTAMYLRDMLGGTTAVDVPNGTGPTGLGFDVGGPSLSSSGRYLAYASEDPAISDDDVDVTSTSFGSSYPLRDIFVYDRIAGTNTLVSRRSGASGAAANNDSNLPSISTNGRYVAFSTGATNLVPGALVFGGVFVRDLRANTTRWVAGRPHPGRARESAMDPSISGDGGKVAYRRRPSGLRSVWQIVVRDLKRGRTTLASRGGRGAAALEDCREPTISANGRYVAFQSYANNLGPHDNGAVMDVFVKDLRSGRVVLASRGPDGPANGPSGKPSISGEGRFVAFESHSSNLSPEDADRRTSVFRYQLLP